MNIVEKKYKKEKAFRKVKSSYSYSDLSNYIRGQAIVGWDTIDFRYLEHD